MKNFLILLFTGKDNQTPDIGRILWAFGMLVFLGMTIAAFIHGEPWKPSDTALGIGTILGGGGVGLGAKGHTEPEA